MATPLASLGEVHQATGALDQALVLYRRVIDLCEQTDCEPEPLARARFGMARILWHRRDQREQSLRLAHKARAGYNRAGRHQDVARIKAWLQKVER